LPVGSLNDVDLHLLRRSRNQKIPITFQRLLAMPMRAAIRGPGECLAVMIAGNGDDLTRIFHVRPVELIAIEFVPMRPMDHIAQVQEERRVCPP
jgi:hypothetical protein